MPDRNKSEVLLKQRKVLADFGNVALQSGDLDTVLHEACRLVGEALGTGRAKVLEIEPGGESLFVRAGVGWDPDVVGQARLAMAEHSSETYAIRQGEPIISQDISQDERFEVPAFMKAAGVAALANVPIFRPGDRAYGLLQVDDTVPRDFDQDDVEFLRTYATILGPVIDRLFKLQELRASEERYRAIVETARDYAILTTDAEGRIETWPQGAQAVLGWSPEEAIGMPVDLTFTPEDRDKAAPEVERLTARTAGVAPDVRWHMRRNGTRIFLDGVTRPLTGPDGTVIGFVKVAQDVTERRQAEEQLKLATEAAALGIFDVDLTTGAIGWDARMREIWGVEPDEVITDDTFMAGVHPEDRSMVRSAVGQALDPAGDHLYRTEYRVRQRASGKECWIAVLGRSHFNGPRPVRLVGTVQDITERKQAEAERAALAQRTTEVLESISDAFYAVDRDWRFTYVNHETEKWWGRSREDLLGKVYWEEFPQAVGSEPYQAHLRAAETREVVRLEAVSPILHHWVDISIYPTPDGGLSVYFRDITERKRAEAERREAEDRFRAIVETATDYAIFTTDAEGRIQIWPKGAQEIFGWSAEEAAGQPMEITYTAEDLAADVPAKERQTARDVGHAPNVRWHLRKDGSRVFIDGVARPLTGPDGTVTGFVKVGQDVTERRATEEALRESEERFQQFGEASSDVLWIRDCESLAYEYLSPAYEQVYGSPREEALRGNQVMRWVELIHPEDRERVLDLLRRVQAGENATETYRVIRPSDGQTRWIRNTDFPLRDVEGRVQRIGGISHDTTEEVQNRERLEVLVNELQHRTRNLITVVSALASQTMAYTGPTEAFREEFSHRLAALSRVQGLLSRAQEEPITLRALLMLELDAMGAKEGERVRLDGPRIRIRPTIVQTLALVIHELATNARKYGALSEGGGRLNVEWQLRNTDDGRRAFLDWREEDLSPTETDQSAAERGGGYGRRLIERALPYSLGAKTTYELGPTELRCTIDLPLDREPQSR